MWLLTWKMGPNNITGLGLGDDDDDDDDGDGLDRGRTV
jgi:hypothetical protein